MKKLLSYLYGGQRWRFAGTLLVTMISNLFEVMLAYVMMQCVDFAMEGSLSQATSLALWLGLYLIVHFATDYFAQRLKWKTLQNAQTNLRNDIAKKCCPCQATASTRKIPAVGWLCLEISVT